MESDRIVHVPVMLQEVLSLLKPGDESELLIDCTLGEGGHSERFLSLFPQLRVCGLDRDAAIQAKARKRLEVFGDRMEFFLGWYNEFFAEYPLKERPDRVLFDLGISVFHYQQSGRGFSFAGDEPLDMRLHIDSGPSAADLVNSLGEKELADIIFVNGEERYSRRIARRIVESRREAKIETARQLAEEVFLAVPVSYRHGRIHPATRTFQALRIHVNRELERIEDALDGAFRALRPGGVLGVISFHSLEDRIVKNRFREWSKDCICPPEQPMCNCGGKALGTLTHRKPILPGEEEVRQNPPSRSAKLRGIRKLRDERRDP